VAISGHNLENFRARWRQPGSEWLNTKGDAHIISTDDVSTPLVMRTRLPQTPVGPANPCKIPLQLLCQFAQVPLAIRKESPPAKKRQTYAQMMELFWLAKGEVAETHQLR